MQISYSVYHQRSMWRQHFFFFFALFIYLLILSGFATAYKKILDDDKTFPPNHSPIWKIIVKQTTAVHHRASCAYPVPRLQAHCSNTWQTDAHARITRQQITVQAQIFYQSTKLNHISLWVTGIKLHFISGVLQRPVKRSSIFFYPSIFFLCREGLEFGHYEI